MNAPPASSTHTVARKLARVVGLETIARTLYQRYRYRRAMRMARVSETSKCRDRLAPYCAGYGLDLGFGGDPLVLHAIRVDFPQPYTDVGAYPVQLGGDARSLTWFQNDCLDFIFSSHLLEDFDDTRSVLQEWLRVLKPGGRLIIYCPDEAKYRAYCERTGAFHNPNHKHADFSLRFVKEVLQAMGGVKFIHENPTIDEYSWELVAEKLGPVAT